jgi:amino acid adenylation domain-containing protein/thioester reductase-like protein
LVGEKVDAEKPSFPSLTALNPSAIQGYPRLSIPQLFRLQASATPDAVALCDPRVRVSYADLGRAVDRLADRLIMVGVRPNDSIAVLLERSARCVAAALATMAAGGVYVPVNPCDPPSRIQRTLSLAGARHVIADPDVHSSLGPVLKGLTMVHPTGPHPLTGASRGISIGPEDPAYTLFTSGSTGVPKGVVVPHRGPVRLVKGGDVRVRYAAEDVVLATANPTFDASLMEWFGALLNGARLVVADRETPMTAENLTAVLHAEKITCMFLGTALFHRYAGLSPEMFSDLRRLIVGGDVLHADAVRRVLDAGCGEIVNAYGPTENAIVSTLYAMSRTEAVLDSVPIGTPVAHSTAQVVREDATPAVTGETGELWVGGDGLALGYLGDPDQTAESFVRHRFGLDTPARDFYRTGDLASLRPDGNLVFHGRVDRQVKVRGFRVELDEVEGHLRCCPGVRDAAVSAFRDRTTDQLVAWIVPVEGADDPQLPGQVRAYLRARLPAPMVPDVCLQRAVLPLNSSGKVDRSVLERETEQRVARYRTVPGTACSHDEEVVAAVWQEVLGLPVRPGSDADFFTLGGTSLHVAQVAVSCRQQFSLPEDRGCDVVELLLRYPQLQDFARQVQLVTRRNSLDVAEDLPDFEAEARLPASWRFQSPAVISPHHRVLLTGATGFLGGYLASALVRDFGSDRVECLIRAASEAEGRRRLASQMRRHGLDPAPAQEVGIVLGDLALPHFGMSPSAFGALGSRICVVVHAAAHLNYAYPYWALRAVNVDGTRTALELTTFGTPKLFHYVSTLDVVAASGPGFAAEDGVPAHPERLPLGYGQSKWVAERMVHHAIAQGLNASISRPCELVGPRRGGVGNCNTLLCALVRSIAAGGTAPDTEMPLDLLPVDVAADSIVYLLGRAVSVGHVHHLVSARRTRMPLVLDRLRTAGHAVTVESYATWLAGVAESVRRDPGHPLAPYLSVLQSSSGPDLLSGGFPEIGHRNADEALYGSGISLPILDARFVDTYLQRLTQKGYMPPPSSWRS